LGAAEGSSIELDKVLCIADGDRVTMGSPTVEGAKVIATSQGEGRGDKTVVLKFKSKVRYSVKTGHRQPHTRFTVDKIIGPGMTPEEPVKKPRRRKKGETKHGT
jgi:large subunit ribosomal protein L21